jgi:phosphoglycerate dehydrogenase-like enzyme
VKVLFTRPWFTRDLPWSGLEPELPALESGQVGGAGLDVYAREPPDPASPLLHHPRMVGTPHTGGLTDVMFRRTAGLFAANLQRWAAGEAPRWTVNAPSPGRASRVRVRVSDRAS